MEVLFWLLVAAVGWTYVGYPLLLKLLAKRSKRVLVQHPTEPTVSLIIAAHNEEKAIRQKIQSSLALDYPAEKLEIIVASDCSTDATHAIVEEFAQKGVRLVALENRQGKTAAQNAAAAQAKGEILVFSDATTELSPGTLRSLVQHFADPRVGCVGAGLDYDSKKGTAVGRGAGAYWRYETAVKTLEGRVNSLIGVSGCLYAVRANLYSPIEPELISDFVIAIEMYKKGYVTVLGTHAVSREKTNENAANEFDMRVRVIVRSINALVKRAAVLNPFRYGFFAFQLISHKVLRYLVPELLFLALLSNIFLVADGAEPAGLYQVTLVGQIALLVGAVVGWLSLKFNMKLPLVHIPFYFVHANAAALWGLAQYLKGERKVTWNPSATRS